MTALALALLRLGVERVKMFAMALPWLLVLELVLYAGCFICGVIAAASLTITQVRQHHAPYLSGVNRLGGIW